jgi:hypothetical protein
MPNFVAIETKSRNTERFNAGNVFRTIEIVKGFFVVVSL